MWEVGVVPLMLSLARNPEERAAMQMFYGQNSFARPFILPPNVAPERVAVLRKAFMDTMKDADFMQEAGKLQIEIDPVSGEHMQKVVENVLATPKSLAIRARALIE